MSNTLKLRYNNNKYSILFKQAHGWIINERLNKEHIMNDAFTVTIGPTIKEMKLP